MWWVSDVHCSQAFKLYSAFISDRFQSSSSPLRASIPVIEPPARQRFIQLYSKRSSALDKLSIEVAPSNLRRRGVKLFVALELCDTYRTSWDERSQKEQVGYGEEKSVPSSGPARAQDTGPMPSPCSMFKRLNNKRLHLPVSGLCT